MRTCSRVSLELKRSQAESKRSNQPNPNRHGVSLEGVCASELALKQSSRHEPVSEMVAAFHRQTVEKSILQEL